MAGMELPNVTTLELFNYMLTTARNETTTRLPNAAEMVSRIEALEERLDYVSHQAASIASFFKDSKCICDGCSKFMSSDKFKEPPLRNANVSPLENEPLDMHQEEVISSIKDEPAYPSHEASVSNTEEVVTASQQDEFIKPEEMDGGSKSEDEELSSDASSFSENPGTGGKLSAKQLTDSKVNGVGKRGRKSKYCDSPATKLALAKYAHIHGPSAAAREFKVPTSAASYYYRRHYGKSNKPATQKPDPMRILDDALAAPDNVSPPVHLRGRGRGRPKLIGDELDADLVDFMVSYKRVHSVAHMGVTETLDLCKIFIKTKSPGLLEEEGGTISLKHTWALKLLSRVAEKEAEVEENADNVAEESTDVVANMNILSPTLLDQDVNENENVPAGLTPDQMSYLTIMNLISSMN